MSVCVCVGIKIITGSGNNLKMLLANLAHST